MVALPDPSTLTDPTLAGVGLEPTEHRPHRGGVAVEERRQLVPGHVGLAVARLASCASGGTSGRGCALGPVLERPHVLVEPAPHLGHGVSDHGHALIQVLHDGRRHVPGAGSARSPHGLHGLEEHGPVARSAEDAPADRLLKPLLDDRVHQARIGHDRLLERLARHHVPARPDPPGDLLVGGQGGGELDRTTTDDLARRRSPVARQADGGDHTDQAQSVDGSVVLHRSFLRLPLSDISSRAHRSCSSGSASQ